MFLQSLYRLFVRLQLWLRVKFVGRRRLPKGLRRQLRGERNSFNSWIKLHYQGSAWRTQILYGVNVQPFQDLLNRPNGGEAYCGGVVFNEPLQQPVLRHFRGQRAIDKPLTYLAPGQPTSLFIEARQFWCGPLAFHFGHQIADFGSRVLLSSLDPRGGELLWCPWKTSYQWSNLLSWQRFLLEYLNPGKKTHHIINAPIKVRELVVIPQQARMHSAPTASHLEALCWCERSLGAAPLGVVYVSRSRFSSCTSSETLLGAFAGEAFFEELLKERGVTILYPETISLKEQLEIYLGAESLIFAEGSAQHGLELLGVHTCKSVVVICRRPQREGMAWPLVTRFPRVKFVEAVGSLWMATDGMPWDGLALLDWVQVASILNPILSKPLLHSDCLALELESHRQLKELSSFVNLYQSSFV